MLCSPEISRKKSAGVSWPLEGVVCVSLCCFVCFSCVVWGCFGLARFLLAASPPLVLPAPSVWSLGAFWSVSAGPSLGYLVVSCDGPVVMPVVWSVVTARLFTFPHGNKGFGRIKKKKGVGGWGLRYLAHKRERGPVRVPRLLSEGIP